MGAAIGGLVGGAENGAAWPAAGVPSPDSLGASGGTTGAPRGPAENGAVERGGVIGEYGGTTGPLGVAKLPNAGVGALGGAGGRAAGNTIVGIRGGSSLGAAVAAGIAAAGVLSCDTGGTGGIIGAGGVTAGALACGVMLASGVSAAGATGAEGNAGAAEASLTGSLTRGVRVELTTGSLTRGAGAEVTSGSLTRGVGADVTNGSLTRGVGAEMISGVEIADTGVLMRGAATGAGGATSPSSSSNRCAGAMMLGVGSRSNTGDGAVAASPDGSISVAPTLGVLARGAGSGAGAATGADARGGAGGAIVAAPPPLANSGAFTGAAKSAFDCAEPTTCMTPPHTEHRARTPPSGTRSGSTRKMDRHSGQVTFMCPPSCRINLRSARLAARDRTPGPAGDPP